LSDYAPPVFARIVARAGFREAEADDAWKRIDAFFAEHLAAAPGE
jgi:dienelactone hydrolase